MASPAHSHDDTERQARKGSRMLAEALIIWGVTSLLLVACLLALHVALKIRYSDEHIFDHFSRLSPSQKSAYAGWKPDDLNKMLTATWSPGWIYEPWVGFREKPRSTEFVNVSEDGIRATVGGARSLAESSPNALFVFGGSTTFGYGVADGETISSHLQSLLGSRVRVFNFGRAYYYTAQENVLLESVLQAGHRPAAAIFVDGLNERCDMDAFQARLAVLFARAQGEYQWQWADAVAPLAFAARKLERLITGKEAPPFVGDLHRVDCVLHGKSRPLREVLRANLEHRARLCAAYRVPCLTFVQPIAGLHGNNPDASQQPESARRKLELKFEHLASTYRSMELVDLTSTLNGLASPAYVDGLHYSNQAARTIAARMAAELESHGTLPARR